MTASFRAALLEDGWQEASPQNRFAKDGWELVSDTSRWWELYAPDGRRQLDIEDPAGATVRQTLLQMHAAQLRWKTGSGKAGV